MSEQYTPKVSVIIPVYNVEPYLRECLDSVVNQTFRDIEIICVNDGSTDCSPAILEEYREKDERITVIIQENRGLSAARNSGMAAARGEYIYFIDSDDYIELNLLEKTVSIADEMKLDVAVFCLKRFSDSKRELCQFPLSQRSESVCSGVEYLKKEKDRGTYLVCVVKALWRHCFLSQNKLCFLEGILHEDVLFCFQAFFLAKRVFQIPDILYHYRIRPNSIMTGPKTQKNVYSYFKCAKAILKYAFQDSNTQEEEHEIWREYTRLAEATSRVYNNLPLAEQAKVVFSSEMDNELFRQIILGSGVTQGKFRVLCAATFLPRKLRGGVQCFREHGLRYTLHRTLEHLTGRA